MIRTQISSMQCGTISSFLYFTTTNSGQKVNMVVSKILVMGYQTTTPPLSDPIPEMRSAVPITLKLESKDLPPTYVHF